MRHEEFNHSNKRADKQRIPYNVASYLSDHPNDARGLNNRIDLRHNTALSGADPDLKASMIDYHNTKNTVGTQLAQNGPPQSLPQGVIQSELAKAYRGMISAGASPEEAAEQAQKLLGLRGATMPKYQVDEYGRAIRSAPGEIDKVMPGVQPGYFG